MLGRTRSTDAQILLRELVGPRMADEPIAQVLRLAAKQCDISYWRIYDIWYGRARRVSDEEEGAILAAIKRKTLKTARNELHELRAQVARLEAMLSRIDQDFNRPTIDALRSIRGQMG